MIKKIIAIAIILSNGMFISCSNEANEDISNYQEDLELYGTGGEDDDDQDIVPPVDPPVIKP